MTPRQPTIPTALVKTAQQAMTGLDVDHQSAATWVHAGALARHAHRVGLVPTMGLRATLESLAGLHERLSYWGKLAAALPAEAEAAIEALWDTVDVFAGADEATVWYSYPLGDLYQTLSVEAVKGRAFCQTPFWVGELLLHISYDRAVEEWADPKVIDPSCGAGHLLVESYIAARGARTMSGQRPDDRACLDAIHGVDLDPHAAATAAYRLLVLAYGSAWTGPWGERHRSLDGLAEAPIHIAQANSLLSDDEPLLTRGQYQVVVANPPYITCKDKDQTAAIRARYPETTHRKFSLALPFHQLMMELLAPGGWCAQLTANSFMKREFGKKYIQDWLPQFDMEWLIDTSGAYIPGHGTPTAIMSHRKQAPVGDSVRVIQGIRGEPSAPKHPYKGLVWTAIRERVYHRENVDRSARLYETVVREHLDRRDELKADGWELPEEYHPDGWTDPREAPAAEVATETAEATFQLIEPPAAPSRRSPTGRGPRLKNGSSAGSSPAGGTLFDHLETT